MVAGSEIATLIEAFEEEDRNSGVDMHHHDETVSVQAALVKDIRSLVDITDELGNPFEEESEELIALQHKGICRFLSCQECPEGWDDG